ncbi:MAG: hypothetical protein GF347_03060 [Candidatus Moranbacteria bacterium]|nr:hypothetical protein [Candidatus Moranbacteria bacterium]
MDNQIFLDFALKTVKKTRSFIQTKIETGFNVSTKKDHSLVTEVDKETEKLIRQEIEKKFPDHGIVGEEFGTKNEKAKFKWFLDPIDGTLSFSNRIPLYGTILALHRENEPIVGVIDHPGLNQSCYALKDRGAFLNGKKITVKDIDSLEDLKKEIIATGDIIQFKLVKEEALYEKLLKEHEFTRTIPDCFGHTLAAQGSVGAMVDFDLSPWDLAATKLIIEEANGKFKLFKKTQLPNGTAKQNVIFGKPKVVDWLCEILG